MVENRIISIEAVSRPNQVSCLASLQFSTIILLFLTPLNLFPNTPGQRIRPVSWSPRARLFVMVPNICNVLLFRETNIEDLSVKVHHSHITCPNLHHTCFVLSFCKPSPTFSTKVSSWLTDLQLPSLRTSLTLTSFSGPNVGYCPSEAVAWDSKRVSSLKTRTWEDEKVNDNAMEALDITFVMTEVRDQRLIN